MSWDDAWREGRTPWDAGQAAPPLVDLLASGALDGAKNALVPGCGGGWDVFAFAHAGVRGVGLDVAESAAPVFARHRDEAKLDATRARLVVGDFFTFAPAERFDVIWDYTFLCALPPAWRARWAERMDTLLAPKGTLATLIFPATHPGPEYVGPPWPLHPDDVRALLLPRGFRELRMERPARSHPAREGKEWIALWSR
ncbi:MAG: methyltransferase domain-containing protein [Polyangiales bacterium]